MRSTALAVTLLALAAASKNVTVLPLLGGCPAPLKDCSGACYLENMYCCPNGVLTQKKFCNDNGGGGGGGSRNGQYGPIENGDRSGADIGYLTTSNADSCQAECFK